ncbi:MAG TPA: nuclear transport factor 2 family protein [Terracidiphilus sp.]
MRKLISIQRLDSLFLCPSSEVFRRIALLAIAVAFALTTVSARAEGNDTAAVLAANARFYSALDKMFAGDVSSMEQVWSHADDVTYMGPTGNFQHGWSAVLKDWEGQAAQKLGGKVEPTGIQVMVGRDLAVVNDYEQGENTNAQGKVMPVKLRATNIFRKEDGQWKMVGHHTDQLSYLTH